MLHWLSTARRRDPIDAPALPSAGQTVAVRRRSSTPLRARVRERRQWSLSIELRDAQRPPRGAVELEWADPEGLARLRGRASVVRTAPTSVVEIRFRKPPELVQRRRHVRGDVSVPCRAWSLLDPTTLIAGTTVNLSGGGALVRLPDLPPATTLVDLTLSLPEAPLATRARVVRRAEPDLVALEFQALQAEDEERLVAFAMPAAVGAR